MTRAQKICTVDASGSVVQVAMYGLDATIADGGSAILLPVADGGSHRLDAPSRSTFIAHDDAQIGWRMEGGELVAPTVSPPSEAAIAGARRTLSVTLFQLVTALKATIATREGSAGKSYWTLIVEAQEAGTLPTRVWDAVQLMDPVPRMSRAVSEIAAAFDLTDAQVDAVFATAAAVEL